MNTPFYRTSLPFFDELVGDRVIIRPYQESEAQALYDLIQGSREHIGRWMTWVEQHTSVEYTRDVIIHMKASHMLREDFDLGLYERESGRLIGGVGIHPSDWDIRFFEIGYWLSADNTGNGYMTEAARLLTNYAFDVWEAQRVEIRCDARNERSAAVARRLGYAQEACLRHHARGADGALRDTLIFALIPDDRS